MNWAANRATKGLGASFKGVSAYLLSAKDGQKLGDRLGFAICRNLATDNPAHAWRLMAETAIRRDQLKLLAGGSAAGRKVAEGAFKPVFHYALSWHPDQRPDQAEMERAAVGSIAALGLAHHEALIVQHNDQGHAHLHVVVNRVDPDNGKLSSLPNAFRKLDRWAAEYERETGQIVSQNREKKHQAIDEGRARPERQRWLPHDEWMQTRQAARAVEKSEGGELWDSQRGARDALLAEAKLRARDMAQALREKQRPGWQELGRTQAKCNQELDKALDSRVGMIDFINRHRELLHKAWPDPDERQREWHTLLTRGGLERAVMRAHEMETAVFRRDVAHDRHEMQRAFWGDYRAQVDQLRQDQTAERAGLREQQRAGVGDRITRTEIKGGPLEGAVPAGRRPDVAKPKMTVKERAQALVPKPQRPRNVEGGEPVIAPRPTEPEAAKAARRALERMAVARRERLDAEAKARARREQARPPGRDTGRGDPDG